MATRQIHSVIQHLRRTVLPEVQGKTDGQLLESFVTRKEEEAFEALLRRHGPMVLAVCHRLLRNPHDAEDAFQAVFLVLARKASSVKPREMVGNWLHGVARQTARKANAMNTKRKSREKQVREMPEPAEFLPDPWPDFEPLLDQELACLPEKYRLPVVLCDLEGKSIREATRQLGWPQGTLAGRLARGRTMLAKRLARRGIALSGGSLAVVLSQKGMAAVIPPRLLVSTAEAAKAFMVGQAAVVSPKAATLAEGVIRAMFITKLKFVVALVIAVGVIGFGSNGLVAQSDQRAGQSPRPIPASSDASAPRKHQEPKLVARTYPIADLITPFGKPGGKLEVAKTLEDELMKVIANVVAPMTWSEHGGRGTMDYFPLGMALVVHQTLEVHEQIAELVAAMRRLQDGTGGDSRPKATRPAAEKKALPPDDDNSDFVYYGTFQFQGPNSNEKQTPPPPDSDNTVRIDSKKAYPAVFNQILSVVADHFDEISHANRYDGRIEARTVASRDGGADHRKASVTIQPCDDGGYSITVRVDKTKTDQQKPGAVSRDTELERKLLKQLKKRLNREAEQPSDLGAAVPGQVQGSRVIGTNNSAEKDYRIAEFYRRTGHPGSAYFYYEIVRNRYPNTPFADKATERMKTLRTDLKKQPKEVPGSGNRNKIERRLEEPITVEFKEAPLSQVIDELRSSTNVNIVIDQSALQAEGIKTNQKVSEKLEGVSMKAALNVLLKRAGLTYVITDEVLQVTTERRAMFPEGCLHDFGTLTRGQKATYTFPIRNTTGAPMTFVGLRVSAVTAKATKEVLQPNEEGGVEVSVDTRWFGGPKIGTIYMTVQTARGQQEYQFTVKVNSRE